MDDRFRNERLRVAEELEITILSSISQFNKHRIDRALAATPRGKPKIVNGMMTVIDGRRLLRPLFVTTEFNLVSSFQKSGLYPFPMLNRMGPDQDISVPNSFFLNASLVSGQNISVSQGLGLTKANEFSRIVRVKSEEYTALVNKFKIGLGGCMPGDADFAWFVPEPSHIDNYLIERLMRRGIVTPEFVAAVVNIDLETPILLNDRASLLKFVPTNFLFQPMPIGGTPLSVKRHPDLLTKQVISTIEQSRPAPESAAAKFMQMLKSRNPLQILQQRINGYLQNMQTQLQQDRPAAVERLFRIAVERRTAVLDHDVLRRLDETIGENGTMHNRLFPLPEAASVDCP